MWLPTYDWKTNRFQYWYNTVGRHGLPESKSSWLTFDEYVKNVHINPLTGMAC